VLVVIVQASHQSCAYVLANGGQACVVDQLQHHLGIHERNRYGSIGLFTHHHVARQQQTDIGIGIGDFCGGGIHLANWKNHFYTGRTMQRPYAGAHSASTACCGVPVTR
jgi:hypothetical protein